MAAVVAIHSIAGFAPLCGIAPSPLWISCALQPFKFGTIGFFLVSGFLMGEGMDRRTPLGYLRRRVRTVLTPWLFWFFLFCARSLAGDLMHHRLSLLRLHEAAPMLQLRLYSYLFGTAYWFVPNLIIGITLLLTCRKFLFDLRLGGALLAISLFYGLNIHTEWIHITSHTEALLGFVFYLWLGAWAARNQALVERWAMQTSLPALIGLAILFAFGAIRESQVIAARGQMVDAGNTLRISNQLYSIAIVLAIFKARRALSPRGLNARKSTFGLYLTHTLVLSLFVGVLARVIARFISLGSWKGDIAIAVALCILGFAITYVTSLSLSLWLLAQPRLSWMVGFPNSKPVPGQARE